MDNKKIPKLVLEENKNKVKIKIGEIDITSLVSSYVIERNFDEKVLKISFPIYENDIKIVSG